jgi:hypothetical protein
VPAEFHFTFGGIVEQRKIDAFFIMDRTAVNGFVHKPLQFPGNFKHFVNGHFPVCIYACGRISGRTVSCESIDLFKPECIHAHIPFLTIYDTFMLSTTILSVDKWHSGHPKMAIISAAYSEN